MIIKHGDGKIIDVIKDSEHNIDDAGTRKALDNVKTTEVDLKDKKEVAPQKKDN